LTVTPLGRRIRTYQTKTKTKKKRRNKMNQEKNGILNQLFGAMTNLEEMVEHLNNVDDNKTLDEMNELLEAFRAKTFDYATKD